MVRIAGNCAFYASDHGITKLVYSYDYKLGLEEQLQELRQVLARLGVSPDAKLIIDRVVIRPDCTTDLLDEWRCVTEQFARVEVDHMEFHKWCSPALMFGPLSGVAIEHALDVFFKRPTAVYVYDGRPHWGPINQWRKLKPQMLPVSGEAGCGREGLQRVAALVQIVLGPGTVETR